MNLAEYEPGELLFHYTEADVGFSKILPEGRFRFSSLARMRDPLENKEWALGGGGWGDDPDLESKYFHASFTADKVKARARLAAFSIDAPDCSMGNDPAGRGWARASMWEHYADRHQGICLVFDKTALCEEFQASFAADGFPSPYHHRVEYTGVGSPDVILSVGPGRIDGTEGAVYEFIENHHLELFFRKAVDWQQEHEYRFLVTAPDGREEAVSASFDSALKAVILGESFPHWSRPSVKRICDDRGIEALKMLWFGGRPMPLGLKVDGPDGPSN